MARDATRHRETTSAWHKAHAEERRAYMKKYRKGNRAKLKKQNRDWRKNNPEKELKYDRKAYLKATYGITPEVYDRMVVEQNGVCAICHRPEPRGFLSVDHDHATLEIRGLLCRGCNLVLGNAEESTATLLSAVDYLRRHKDKTK